jgi:hypothetical protein
MLNMNTSKTIVSNRIGGDYFVLIYSRRSKLYLKDFINQFDFKNYHCFKSSGKQRLINEKDFLEFKYSKYVFFKKDKYDLENINEWIKYFNNFGGIQFIDKPVPPFSPNKIIIKKC